jgi:hypothetical protein
VALSQGNRTTVTTGEALRATLIRDNGIDPARIDSIPTGVDTSRFAPGDAKSPRGADSADAPLIGIVATLRSWKGHRFLLDASRPEHRNARLDCRRRPQRANLRHRSQTSHCATASSLQASRTMSHVALPRSTSSRCLRMRMRACPRRCWAMMSGIACVTTDAGAIPEIMRRGETRVVRRKMPQPRPRPALADAYGGGAGESACARLPRYGLHDAGRWRRSPAAFRSPLNPQSRAFRGFTRAEVVARGSWRGTRPQEAGGHRRVRSRITCWATPSC